MMAIRSGEPASDVCASNFLIASRCVRHGFRELRFEALSLALSASRWVWGDMAPHDGSCDKQNASKE